MCIRDRVPATRLAVRVRGLRLQLQDADLDQQARHDRRGLQQRHDEQHDLHALDRRGGLDHPLQDGQRRHHAQRRRRPQQPRRLGQHGKTGEHTGGVDELDDTRERHVVREREQERDQRQAGRDQREQEAQVQAHRRLRRTGSTRLLLRGAVRDGHGEVPPPPRDYERQQNASRSAHSDDDRIELVPPLGDASTSRNATNHALSGRRGRWGVVVHRQVGRPRTNTGQPDQRLLRPAAHVRSRRRVPRCGRGPPSAEPWSGRSVAAVGHAAPLYGQHGSGGRAGHGHDVGGFRGSRAGGSSAVPRELQGEHPADTHPQPDAQAEAGDARPPQHDRRTGGQQDDPGDPPRRCGAARWRGWRFCGHEPDIAFHVGNASPRHAKGRTPVVAGPASGVVERDQPIDCMISRIRAAVSDGVLPTLTPAASRASFFACAVPAEPETMAPAWPMVLPSGAVKPAT